MGAETVNATRHRGSGSSDGLILIDRRARLVLRHHVQSQYPEEACGGLLGSTSERGRLTVSEAAPLANTLEVERRRHRYLLGPDDVLRLERRAEAGGLQVVGFYHSHPDVEARPSAFDLQHAWPFYIYLIVTVVGGQAGEMTAWRLTEDRGSFQPLVIDASPSLRNEDGSR